MLERPKISPSQQPKSLVISPSDLASKSLGVKIENGQVPWRKIFRWLGLQDRRQKTGPALLSHRYQPPIQLRGKYMWFITICHPPRNEMRQGWKRNDISITLTSLWRLDLRYHALLWRQNGRDGVSNHQPRGCLLNRSFRHRSKKTSKLRVTGLCAGNSPVIGEFPTQKCSNAENVSIWWRHHEHYTYCQSRPHLEHTEAGTKWLLFRAARFFYLYWNLTLSCSWIPKLQFPELMLTKMLNIAWRY